MIYESVLLLRPSSCSCELFLLLNSSSNTGKLWSIWCFGARWFGILIVDLFIEASFHCGSGSKDASRHQNLMVGPGLLKIDDQIHLTDATLKK